MSLSMYKSYTSMLGNSEFGMLESYSSINEAVVVCQGFFWLVNEKIPATPRGPPLSGPP